MIKVNGREFAWRTGLTLRDIMVELRYTAPKIVVKVNGELIRQASWAIHQVNDGDDVRMIHLIGGG